MERKKNWVLQVCHGRLKYTDVLYLPCEVSWIVSTVSAEWSREGKHGRCDASKLPYLSGLWPCWQGSWWRCRQRWACGWACWGLPCRWSPPESARPPSHGCRWTCPIPWLRCWSQCWQDWSPSFGAERQKKEGWKPVGRCFCKWHLASCYGTLASDSHLWWENEKEVLTVCVKERVKLTGVCQTPVR